MSPFVDDVASRGERRRTAIRQVQQGLEQAAAGRLNEAADSLWAAAETDPRSVDAYFHLGRVRLVQRRFADARECFQQALQLCPAHADSLTLLAGAFRAEGDSTSAVDCYQRALKQRPQSPELLNDLANAWKQLGRFDDAIRAYRRALEIKPDYAEIRHNLGTAYYELRELDAAVDAYQESLRLKPDFRAAYDNLATALAEQGRIDEAAAVLQRSQSICPGDGRSEIRLAGLCPVVFADREAIDQYRGQSSRKLSCLAGERVPLDLATLSTSQLRPSWNLQFPNWNIRPLKEAFARVFEKALPGMPVPPGSGNRRPRIGFVVTNSHERAFLKSLGGVLHGMRKDRFELFVVCQPNGAEKIRQGIRSDDVNLLVVPWRFDQIVAAVRDARFDLLYHWEIGTDDVNYFLPYVRLAPVQCTSWGVQVTSGIPTVDYYLSSELVEPADGQEHYSENLVLAETLLTCQPRLSPPRTLKAREEFGFNREHRLYVCAQHLGKFQPEFDATLAEILRHDERGRIVITNDEYGYAGRQLQDRFVRSIPDVAERIVFVPRLRQPEYLSLLAAADVLLDPYGFGGVNGTYDGLSLNQPIVTLPSKYHRGRYTLGCYRKMGLSECVAEDQTQYVEIAVRLANDSLYRREVVEQIRETSDVLFDDRQAVAEHERIFRELIERSK